ncbi:hypothetical protein GOBAR_DD16676 [Gossypium barbadense]|nr:hypothetical protein GOBAR_DD16676 [Gossypium barbadense]
MGTPDIVLGIFSIYSSVLDSIYISRSIQESLDSSYFNFPTLILLTDLTAILIQRQDKLKELRGRGRAQPGTRCAGIAKAGMSSQRSNKLLDRLKLKGEREMTLVVEYPEEAFTVPLLLRPDWAALPYLHTFAPMSCLKPLSYKRRRFLHPYGSRPFFKSALSPASNRLRRED